MDIIHTHLNLCSKPVVRLQNCVPRIFGSGVRRTHCRRLEVAATAAAGGGGPGGRLRNNLSRRFGPGPDPFKRPLRPSGLLGLLLLVLAGRAEETGAAETPGPECCTTKATTCGSVGASVVTVDDSSELADPASTTSKRQINHLVWLVPLTCMLLATDASLLGYGTLLGSDDGRR